VFDTVLFKKAVSGFTFIFLETKKKACDENGVVHPVCGTHIFFSQAECQLHRRIWLILTAIAVSAIVC
jgi:hypothetical protein